MKTIRNIRKNIKNKFFQICSLLGTASIGISEAVIGAADSMSNLEGIPPSLYVILFAILLINFVVVSPPNIKSEAEDYSFSDIFNNAKKYVQNNKALSLTLFAVIITSIILLALPVAAIIPIALIATIIFAKDIISAAKGISSLKRSKKSSKIRIGFKFIAVIMSISAGIMLINSLNGLLEAFGISGDIFSTGADSLSFLPGLLIMAIFAISAYAIYKTFDESLTGYIESFEKKFNEVTNGKEMKNFDIIKKMLEGGKKTKIIALMLTVIAGVGITFIPMASLWGTLSTAFSPALAIIAMSIFVTLTAIITFTAASRVTKKTFETFSEVFIRPQEESLDNTSANEKKHKKPAIKTTKGILKTSVAGIGAITIAIIPVLDLNIYLAVVVALSIFIITFATFMNAFFQNNNTDTIDSKKVKPSPAIELTQMNSLRQNLLTQKNSGSTLRERSKKAEETTNNNGNKTTKNNNIHSNQ